jgi:predicted transcriptional regulator
MYHPIQTLRALGKSQRQIAAELRISKSIVNKYCQLSATEGETHCLPESRYTVNPRTNTVFLRAATLSI